MTFIVLFMITEFFVLFRMLKAAASQGNMPKPMSDAKGIAALKGERYRDD